MASIVWRKILGTRAAPILFLLCVGGLTLLAYNPDAGVLVKADKSIAQGAMVVSLLSILSVLFLGGTEIALELHDRTAMFWLAHPVARWQYVLGKLLGSCIVGWTLLLVLGTVMGLLFLSRGLVPRESFFIPLGAAALRVMILSALLTCLSTGLGYMQATFLGGVICLMGLASYALPLYAYLMGVTPAAGLLWVLYFLIPNWDHFGFGLEIGLAAGPVVYWLLLILYSLAYSAFFAALAVLGLQFRDIN